MKLLIFYRSFLLFGVLLAPLATRSYAQTLRVLEAGNQQPVPFATLRSTDPQAIAQCDEMGQVSLRDFRGAVQIDVRQMGYREKSVSYSELAAAEFILYLDPIVQAFETYVVSATRWRSSARSVPAKITQISPEDRALLQPQTAADLLATSGEVFIQKSQQGGGSPMIRGFSANRLLYTVDGIRMNSAIFRSGNLHNVISLDPLSIQSTEVLFGPGAVLYGSDAIGGVMSFQTLRPTFSTSDTLYVSGAAELGTASANGHLRSHAQVQLAGKKWAALSSFTHNRFGDLRMGRRGGRPEYLRPFFVQRIDGEDRIVENPDPLVQRPTSYEQFNFMQKLRYQPHADWDLEYAFHFSETGDFPRYDRLIETQADGSPRSADWRYGPQRWHMHVLSALHQGQNTFYDQLAVRVAHQYFEESRINRNFSGGQRFRLRSNLEEVNALSTQVDAEKSWGRRQLFYGLEYIWNTVSSAGSAIDIRDGSPIAVPDRYPQGTWTSYAAYLNYRWTLRERWILQAGIRHGGFGIEADFRRQLAFFPFDFEQSSLQKQATTGSAGLIWMPNDSWTLSGTLSTGFRAPNLDDIGKIFDFVGGEVVVPNPSLNAEYAYNAELHASKVLGDWLKLDFTSYYTYLDAAIVRRPFQIAGQDSILFNGVLSRILALQNAAFGRVWGFHLGFEALLARGLTLTTRYNFQRGQEELEDGSVSASRHAAPAFGQSQLRYQNKAFTGILYLQYSAAVPFERLAEEERQKPALYVRDENGQLFSPSWSTWNLKFMWQIAKPYQLTAGVENLLDLQYRPYSSGLVAPGRNVTLAFRVHF